VTTIHSSAMIDAQAHIDEGVEVGPYCVIGPDVRIANGCKLVSHVVIRGRVTLGENNEVHPFASLGQPPQDLKYAGESTELVIGRNNSIRESVTMSLGTDGGGGITRVGDNNLFMALAHVGHDCRIANHCVFANGATLGGHVDVGDYAIIGGLSAIHQFVRVGRHAIIGGVSPVVRDVIPFGAVSGNRASLDGLNIVGLRRRGFDKKVIRDLTKAYKLIFEETNSYIEERAKKVAAEYHTISEVNEWFEFIKSSKRGLCIPMSFESKKTDV